MYQNIPCRFILSFSMRLQKQQAVIGMFWKILFQRISFGKSN